MFSAFDREEIDNSLIVDTTQNLPLGLAEGKMGLCIYFFCIGRMENNPQYIQSAEKLLRDIFNNIKNVNTIDLEEGLSGIGLGIHFLIKNGYVEGDINDVLENVDDVVFRHLNYSSYWNNNVDILFLIKVLFYLYVRIKELKVDSESRQILEETAIEVLNRAYQEINPSFFRESLNYTVNYPLPLFLFAISGLGSLHFYNYRIVKIIEELAPQILSVYPALHSNKLFLAAGMKSARKLCNVAGWSKHIDLLVEGIDFNKILEEEIGNRNIYFKDGFASILFLVNILDNLLPQKRKSVYESQVRERIESSGAWELFRTNLEYKNKHVGLFSGVPGCILSLNYALLK